MNKPDWKLGDVEVTGWGWVCLPAVVLPIFACAGLVDWNKQVAMLVCSALFFGFGIPMWIFSRKEAAQGRRHVLNVIPMQWWSVLCIISGVIVFITLIGNILKDGFGE